MTIQSIGDESLVKIKEMFEKAFKQSSIPMGITDIKDGKFIEVSDAFLNLTGLSRDQLVENTSIGIGIITPEKRSFVLSELQTKDIVENMEIQVTKKGGEVRDGLLNIYKISIGYDDYLITIFTDITDRKRSEDAIRESEARFRDLTENTTDWIWEMDNRLGTVYSSPGVMHIIGYSPEEILGKKMTDFLPPEEAKRIQSIWNEMTLNPQPWRSIEYTILHKDGSPRVLESNGIPIFDTNGRFKGYRGIDRDVTRHKNTEHLLEMSQKKFVAAFHDSPAPMVITEAESGKTIEVNKAGVSWTGYSHDETIGKTGIELGFITTEERSQFAKEIYTKGHVDSRLIKFKTRNGEIRDIIHSARLIEIDNRPCVLSHLHDITDQRRAEEKLKQYHDHLEDLVKERTAKLANANIKLRHEIEIRKTTEESLRARELELDRGRKDLEEMNAALRVLLKQRENDKLNLENNIISNIKVSVMPYVERLNTMSLKEDEKHCLSMIKSHLEEIASPFIKKLSSQFLSLTPSEIQIASMIREGKRSKDIAEIMNISLNTVHSYRYNIRVKIGLKNNKVNLRSYLQTLD